MCVYMYERELLNKRISLICIYCWCKSLHSQYIKINYLYDFRSDYDKSQTSLINELTIQNKG